MTRGTKHGEMVMVRAVSLPAGQDPEDLLDLEQLIVDGRRSRAGSVGSRRPLVLTSITAVLALLGLVGGFARWPLLSGPKQEAEGSATVVQIDVAVSGRRAKHQRNSWVPEMAPGLVAAKVGKVPDWHQCWTPLCDPGSCAANTQPPELGALLGLRILVLSHGGRQVGLVLPITAPHSNQPAHLLFPSPPCAQSPTCVLLPCRVSNLTTTATCGSLYQSLCHTVLS